MFWDIHDYPLLDDIDAYDLSLEVCKALRELDSSNEISLCAYGDSKNRMNGPYEGFTFRLNLGEFLKTL